MIETIPTLKTILTLALIYFVIFAVPFTLFYWIDFIVFFIRDEIKLRKKRRSKKTPPPCMAKTEEQGEEDA